MRGSLKNPTPTPNVVILMNMADVVNNDTATPGTRTEAKTRRGFSFGKGGVGDKALGDLSIAGTSPIMTADSLCKSFPSVGHVFHGMHDGPHLAPHGVLHRLLSLVVMLTGNTALG